MAFTCFIKHSGTVRDRIQKQTGRLITNHFFGAGTGMLYLHKNIIVLYTAQLILYLGWGLDMLWHIEIVTFRRTSWIVRLSVFQSINRWNTWVGYLWSLLHRAQKVHVLPEKHTHAHNKRQRHTLISVHPGIFKPAHSGTEWCTNTSTPTFIFRKNSSIKKCDCMTTSSFTNTPARFACTHSLSHTSTVPSLC